VACGPAHSHRFNGAAMTRQERVAVYWYSFATAFGCQLAWDAFVRGRFVLAVIGVALAIPAAVLAWRSIRHA